MKKWFQSRKNRKKLLAEYKVNLDRILYLTGWAQEILVKEYKTISVESGDKLEDLMSRIRFLHDRNATILSQLRVTNF